MKTHNLHQQELAAYERGASVFIVDVGLEPSDDYKMTPSEDGEYLFKFKGGAGASLLARKCPYQPGDEVGITCEQRMISGRNDAIYARPVIKDVRCKQLKSLTPLDVVSIVASRLGQDTAKETIVEFYQSTGREWDDEKWVFLNEFER